jgi:hypothetical protein
LGAGAVRSNLGRKNNGENRIRMYFIIRIRSGELKEKG